MKEKQGYDKDQNNMTDYMRVMKQFRIGKDWTQQDIAKKMGMKQQLYSNIETGRTRLSIEFANRFKEFFGIDLLNKESSKLPEKKILSDNYCQQLLNENELLKEKIFLHYSEAEDLKEEITNKEKAIERLNKYISLLESKLKMYE